ncbi:MAG: phosphatidylserine decarboxylase family protein [Candidatus Acidiferrales bacterium]
MVRTGFYFASGPVLVAGVAAWRGWWAAGAVFFLLGAFVLYFFRDPERRVPMTPGAVVSPADGRVMSINNINEHQPTRTQISIFLSLFDVHVNRSPIAGSIASVRYRPGRFHVASREEAGRENEQNEVTVEGEGTQVTFRQIAGLLARRIEFWPRPGDALERGQRVGMIRFGSRVEVLLEPGYRVLVNPGEHVRGGSSIVAIRE